jgi:hypothetical protein
MTGQAAIDAPVTGSTAVRYARVPRVASRSGGWRVIPAARPVETRVASPLPLGSRNYSVIGDEVEDY